MPGKTKIWYATPSIAFLFYKITLSCTKLNKGIKLKKLLFVIFFSQILSTQTIHSPNKKQALTFTLSKEGSPTYELKYGSQQIILSSKLGILIKDQAPLADGFIITKIETSKVDESWEPVLGEVKKLEIIIPNSKFIFRK